MKKEESQKKEIGLWKVSSFIIKILASIFSIFSGIVTIKAGQIFVGGLFILWVAFLFIPKKYLKITSVLKGAIFVVVYFLLILISGMGATPSEPQYENYFLGQSFNITSKGVLFSVVITNTSEETKVIIDGKETTTSGIYLFVNGILINTEKSSATFYANSELRDSEENVYKPILISTGMGSLQPNLERAFYYFFEIPKNASGLNFYIEDKSKVIKRVDLSR